MKKAKKETKAAIVQARMGSTRLPKKVLLPIKNVPIIELLLSRLSKASKIDSIIVVTSENPNNMPLISHLAVLGYIVFIGSEDDVLDRYYQAALKYKIDTVIRITGDCPLVDPFLVDEAISVFEDNKVDYVSNINPPTYPNGLDIEVFGIGALRKAWNETEKQYDREHVTPYIRESGLFKTLNISYNKDYSLERWTLDEYSDYIVIKNIFEYFWPNKDFTWQDVLELKIKRPELFKANNELMRNEGSNLGTGQKLWKRAKRVIPCGNMLLSKRTEMVLPLYWPAYFVKAKGCFVWDLDGNEFTDVFTMGNGTNTLGYGHPEVDEVVRDIIDNGNMSSFNCPEEVYLAEKLVGLHPWSDMVRFARTGGEANAIAVRIARAASGKDKIAFCGYHGWHDWYLAANLGDEKNLAGHLLPGLEPNGVPENLRGTVIPFTYNRFEELEEIVRNHDIGVIKMEVARNQQPKNGFLEKVRKLATEKNIVLVFDECTSGFRQSLGGLHKIYGVDPDMAVFGKALGNGYAITAVIGKRDVMEAAQSTFISSTFWTERIGPAAGLKTLEIMERERSYEKITDTGRYIAKCWNDLADTHGLEIHVGGIPALINFSIDSPHFLAYKTLITQEMLKKGWLGGNSVYVCTEHTKEIVDLYMENLDHVFKLIKECEEGGNVTELLEGPVCHDGFKRLN